ncbi:uncharacterized protein LOC124266351 [Haliotis rubra]|uniref:uncharacterized protein LOC124266351 n=1 Tax=Haliotis rubra TaxID=36100 RepID=UPI001EE57766|nr:uncharacterized protein LOC124266351 [Haliotis rubra]
MMSLVVVAFVVIGATLSDGALTNHTVAYCEKTMNSTCQRHIADNEIFCGNDGKKYHSICEYILALCEYHIHVVGYGENCTKRTHPTQTPPSHFELGLFGAITNGIDDRLRAVKAKNISVADAKKVYTVQDHANKVYVRNPDCWAYDLDLTSISPWNSNLANRKAGTLVSPRHALWARHYSIKVNSTIRFVDQNNNVVDRRVVKTQTVSGPSHSSFYGQDIVVGELDSDVPNTISFSKVMPRNLTSFRVPYSTHIPAVSTDQEEKALVDDFYYYSSTNAGLHVPLTTSIRHDYYESKISGDSGNPTFFVIDDQLALLFVFTTGGAGGGTSINHYFDNINEIMAKEGGGYQLTEIDLSKYLAKGESLPGIIGK